MPVRTISKRLRITTPAAQADRTQSTQARAGRLELRVALAESLAPAALQRLAEPVPQAASWRPEAHPSRVVRRAVAARARAA